jgi:hypothetical protein
MFPTVPNGGNLTHEQRIDMTDHHFAIWGCGFFAIRLSGGHT